MRIKYPSPRYRRRQAIKQAIPMISIFIVVISAFGIIFMSSPT
jgi:hypothetical protein